MLRAELVTFLMAMVPVIELRGAIPYGVIAGLSVPTAFVLAVIGNLVPIPFLIVFTRKVFDWLKSKSEWLSNLVHRMEAKADKRKGLVERSEFLGLVILVAIPLPGTGAWTGTLAASILDMDFKKSVLAVIGGVALAGAIMGILSFIGVGVVTGIAS